MSRATLLFLVFDLRKHCFPLGSSIPLAARRRRQRVEFEYFAIKVSNTTRVQLEVLRNPAIGTNKLSYYIPLLVSFGITSSRSNDTHVSVPLVAASPTLASALAGSADPRRGRPFSLSSRSQISQR